MKPIRHIALFLLAAAACLSCGKDEAIDIPAQREAFEAFLAGVAENTGLAVDTELARRHNIYRITPGPGGSTRRVANGDAVTIEYYGFAFNRSAEWGMGGLFATNDPEAAVESGLTENPARVLPPQDLTIRQGAGEILHGIDRGLEGAGLRDTVLLYLTSDLTYGTQGAGVVSAGKPTVFMVIINDINN